MTILSAINWDSNNPWDYLGHFSLSDFSGTGLASLIANGQSLALTIGISIILITSIIAIIKMVSGNSQKRAEGKQLLTQKMVIAYLLGMAILLADAIYSIAKNIF